MTATQPDRFVMAFDEIDQTEHGSDLIERGFSLPEIEEIMGYAPGAASAWRLQASWLAWLDAQKTPDKSVITENTQPECRASHGLVSSRRHNFRSISSIS
mgnify:CR=1 FL=1